MTSPPTPIPPPDAVIAVQCVAARTLQFDGSGSTGAIDPDGYAWDFGDLTNGSGMIVTHDYQGAAGIFTVTLTVTGPGGTSPPASLDVDVPCK